MLKPLKKFKVGQKISKSSNPALERLRHGENVKVSKKQKPKQPLHTAKNKISYL